VKLDSSAKSFLVDKGFDPALGARPLRRAVENYLESPLADAILSGKYGEAPVSIRVTAGDGELKFRKERR
jgi:ATP-dependent Clp protease ATP-binding subunit ClpB